MVTGGKTEFNEEDFKSDRCLAYLTDHGDEVPAALMEKPTFKFDLASFFEYYSFINVTTFAKMIGINSSLMRQYKKGNTYISDAQLEKIQTFVNNMGTDFQGLRLV